MKDIEQLKWVSARIGKEKYHTEITTDTHTIVSDEPVDVGGKDEGPAPGDFLRISLASCTAITLRMYADRKIFPVDHIEVKVYSEQVDDKTIFHRTVKISGSLNEQQLKRMLQIADACPIHKVLTNPIEVRTTLN